MQTSHSQPHHQFTAADWQRIEDEPEFRALLKSKRRFIIPAVIFFIVYYFSLPVLVGYHPGLMSRKIGGTISIAYLFALSQFVMAWAVMGCYLYRARRFDELERAVIKHVRGEYE
ncbi:MAG: DUF485 domain-containing protein [Candidatus Eremiobacteraeota bacterium]|nr:DUF485 domain-containing protein [Candidatus Eremiobacteraeota bacterium]